MYHHVLSQSQVFSENGSGQECRDANRKVNDRNELILL